MSQTEPAPTPPEGVDDRTGGSGYDWGDQAETDYAKRFPGGPSEMYRSINEGTKVVTQLSAAEQRAAELEEQLAEIEAERAAEPWRDPLESLPADVLPEATVKRLEAVFARDPVQAWELAKEAAPGYGDVVQNMVMQAWLARDPIGAMRHFQNEMWNPVLDERFQSMEDVLAERLGPMVSHSIDEINNAAIMLSRNLAPDIGAYEDRIGQAIVANPALLSDVSGNVQASAERLVQMRDMLWAAEQRVAANGKKEEVDPEKVKKADLPAVRPRQAAMGRSDVEGPALVDDDYAKRMSIKPRRGRGVA